MKSITARTVLSNLLEIFSGMFFVICTVLVIVNVFLRYFLNVGLYWSEEVCTGCFVWAVYLGAAACYKRRIHMGVDLIVKKLPGRARKTATVIVDFILVILNGFITYQSYVYISLSHTKPTPVLDISTAFISSSLVVSFACMFVFSIIFMIRDIRMPLVAGEGGRQ